MNARIPLSGKMDAEVLKQGGFNPVIPVGTKWTFEHLRKNANGIYEKIDEWVQGNVVTTQGLNHMLDVTFHGTTALGTWYLLIFEDNYIPLIGDTYAVPGFNESTAYDEATRPAFVEAAASGKVITNTANKATFTMNDTKTIYGAALVSATADGNTKDNTAGAGGVMFCASKFSTAKAVVSTDILQVSCSITLADV